MKFLFLVILALEAVNVCGQGAHEHATPWADQWQSKFTEKISFP
jgi:hypothetical protein